MAWWHSYTSVGRDELMAGAVELANHGWPVLPGTFWQGRRWTGTPDAPRSGSVPVLENGLAGATCDRSAIVGWWSDLPYSVLLPTGSALDAIEVSPPVGRRLSAYLAESGIAAPAGTTPTGRWWFLVGAGEALRPELESRADVTLRGRGSWVVVPPSQDPGGMVRWCVPPVPAAPFETAVPPVPPVPLETALPLESPAGIDSRGAANPPATPSLPAARPSPESLRPKCTPLPDTYDVQLALLDVLGQRSMVAAAASAVGAIRAHPRP